MERGMLNIAIIGTGNIAGAHIDGRELITAIYKAGTEGRTIDLPIKKTDSFYTVQGIMSQVPKFYKKTASVKEFGGSITLGSDYNKKKN
jgi:hypothetical protein